MKKNLLIAFMGSLVIGSLVAHDHHHLSKEKLVEMVTILLEQKAHYKAELEKAQHKLDHKHRVHELEKALECLLK